MGAAAISEILSSAGIAGIAISALIDGLVVDVANSCSRPPVDLPTWDANDAISFVVGTPSPTWPTTQGKINNFIYNRLWYLYCECNGETPPAPPPPAPPAGLTGGATSGVRPCAVTDWSGAPPFSSGQALNTYYWDIGPLVLPVLEGPPLQLTYQNVPWNAYPVAPNLTWLNYTRSPLDYADEFAVQGPFVMYACWAANHSLIKAFDLTAPGPAPVYQTGTRELDANTAYMMAYAGLQLHVGDMAPPASTQFTLHSDYLCGAAPGQANDCCPPDPNITLALNNIVHILNDIENRLSGAPVTWVDGLVHQGLTGSGRLQLAAGTIGVRLEFTAVPPLVGNTPGDPSFYWDLGFLTPLAVDVPLRGWRTVFNPQSYALPSVADGIAWTLAPGAVMRLVELHAPNP